MPFSVLTSNIKAELKKFTAFFADAEDAIKYAQCAVDSTKIEDIAGGVVIPAINQLRYAGKHVSNAMLSDAEEVAIKEIIKAQTHCERAIYDAYDAAVQYYFANCLMFKADYKDFPITPVIPKFVDDCTKLNELMDRVSLERRNLKEWNQFVQEKKEQTQILCEISQRWESAREELNKQMEISKKNALTMLKRDRKTGISMWVAIISLVAALATICLSVIQPKIQDRQNTSCQSSTIDLIK